MLKSISNKRMGILLMLSSSMCVCIGQLCWKLSAQSGYLYLLAGFALYGLGTLLMLTAYKFGSLSVLQPMLSINYVFTILLGWYILHETITPMKVIGTLIITVSVILIGGGDD
ncbi:MAG: EamA family transporter [Hyphomonadaceae bacterium]|nr:EamA family transporter [Clostridia bacterium]